METIKNNQQLAPTAHKCSTGINAVFSVFLRVSLILWRQQMEKDDGTQIKAVKRYHDADRDMALKKKLHFSFLFSINSYSRR